PRLRGRGQLIAWPVAILLRVGLGELDPRRKEQRHDLPIGGLLDGVQALGAREAVGTLSGVVPDGQEDGLRGHVDLATSGTGGAITVASPPSRRTSLAIHCRSLAGSVTSISPSSRRTMRSTS